MSLTSDTLKRTRHARAQLREALAAMLTAAHANNTRDNRLCDLGQASNAAQQAIAELETIYANIILRS